MNRRRSRLSFRRERGQAVIFVVILLPVLLGLSALGIDVGGWYTQSRKAQSAADASALAAAWWLRPQDTSQYPAAIAAGQEAFATNSADWNPGGATADFTVPFDSGYTNPVETVQVVVHATAHTFFAKIFGLGGVNITKTAVAARAEKDITPQLFAYGQCDGQHGNDNGFLTTQSGMNISGGIISNGQFDVSAGGNQAGAAIQYVGSGSGSGGGGGGGKGGKGGGGGGSGGCAPNVVSGNGFPDPQVLPTADPNPWDWPMIFSPSEFSSQCTYKSPFTYIVNGKVTTSDDLLIANGNGLQGVLDGSQLKSGVYCVTGQTKITSDNITGNVTFLGSGKIQIYGAGIQFSPYLENVQFFACYQWMTGSCQWEGELHLAGDNLEFSGIVYAPQGGVEIGEGAQDEDKLSENVHCADCLVEGYHVKVLAPFFRMVGTPAGDPLQPVGLVKLVK